MIRVDVIRMAGDAGLTTQEIQALMGPLERLVDLAQAAEREACAKVAEDTPRSFNSDETVADVVAAIRQRFGVGE